MTTNNSWNSENPAQVARGGTGLSSTTAFAVICGGTTSTGDLQSIADVGSSGQVLTSNGAALPTFQANAGGGGAPTQQVRTATSALFDLSTAMPFDDTIPQITEGVEILTLAITPNSASSILVIEATVMGTMLNSSAIEVSMALFVDATAGALAADLVIGNGGEGTSRTKGATSIMRYSESSASTDARTYRLRCGSDSSNTGAINGEQSTRRYGGVAQTTLYVTEWPS